MTTEFRELMRRLAPLVGTTKVEQWYRAYLLSDYKERQELEQCISVYAMDLLKDSPATPPAGQFPPPPAEVCAGEIHLGRVKYGGRLMHPVGLRKSELLRHVGIYGSSGAGKSNGLALILDGLSKQRVPWWLVDFKRTFRSLLKSPEHEDLLVFTVGDSRVAPFAFNPLIPPRGTTTDVWSKRITGLVSHAFMQGAGSESLLVTAIQQAYVDAAKELRWPTFRDVHSILEEMPARGRRALWMDSARRAMQSLTTGNASDVFCSDNPLDLATLLRRRMVLEIELLNVAEATLLSESVLVYVLQHFMHNNRNREELVHAIFIEEAHHLLRSPPGIGDGSEPVIHGLLREVRELGVAVVLASQNGSMVPLPVFGNQATTLAFHTKHQRDVTSTAQAMLLKDEAKDELGRLPVGEAIIRLPRCHDPLHIALEYRPIPKGSVSDTDLAQYMVRSWYSAESGNYQAAAPESRPVPPIPPPDVKEMTIKESASPGNSANNVPNASPPPTTPGKAIVDQEFPFTECEALVFKDIVQNPFSGVVERIKRLGLSRRKAAAVLRALEAQGLTKPVLIYTGTAQLKLFDLTEDGMRLCRRAQLGALPNRTEGGVIHRFIVHRVAERLRADGWHVKTEHPIADDLTVDIHAEADGRLCAVLVETGKSSYLHNVKQTQIAGYTDVHLVTPTPDVAARLKQSIHEKNRLSVPIQTFAEFMVGQRLLR